MYKKCNFDFFVYTFKNIIFRDVYFGKMIAIGILYKIWNNLFLIFSNHTTIATSSTFETTIFLGKSILWRYQLVVWENFELLYSLPKSWKRLLQSISFVFAPYKRTDNVLWTYLLHLNISINLFKCEIFLVMNFINFLLKVLKM